MAECPLEACTVDASGKGRPAKPKPASAELDPGVEERLRLRLKRKQLAQLDNAIDRGKKPKVKINAEAIDAAGNRSARSLKVRAK